MRGKMSRQLAAKESLERITPQHVGLLVQEAGVGARRAGGRGGKGGGEEEIRFWEEFIWYLSGNSCAGQGCQKYGPLFQQFLHQNHNCVS